MTTDGEFVLSLLEQVGTEVRSRNGKVGGVLNRRPPIIRKKRLAYEPRRDRLLTRLRLPEQTKSGSKSGLTAANVDGPLERSNVRFIHEARMLTNPFVLSNNPICVTANKSACMVDLMANDKKTAVVRLRPKAVRAKKTPPNPIGADGRTLRERLDIAMGYKSGLVHRTYTEADLVLDANRIAGATGSDPMISQQSVNAIRRGKSTRSNFTPFLAEACGVRFAWLANGTEPMINNK